MSYCPYCNFKIGQGWKFCPQCTRQLPSKQKPESPPKMPELQSFATPKKKKRSISALSLLITFLLIPFIVVVILFIFALPNFIRARDTTFTNKCINNLRLIQAAKDQYAIENSILPSYIPTKDQIRVYLKNNKLPIEPTGSSYSINAINTNCTCNSGIPSHVLKSLTSYNKAETSKVATKPHKKVVNIKPSYMDYIEQGLVNVKNSHYQEAIGNYKHAISINPSDSDAYIYLGTAYAQLGRKDEAVESYKKGIKTSKTKHDHAKVNYMLGVEHIKLKRYKYAIEFLKIALKNRPGYVEAHYDLGIAYLLTRDKAAAQQQQQALKDLDIAKASMLQRHIDNIN